MRRLVPDSPRDWVVVSLVVVAVDVGLGVAGGMGARRTVATALGAGLRTTIALALLVTFLLLACAFVDALPDNEG